MSMQAAFEALDREADEWDTTATALGTARQAVNGLHLSPDNFSFITFVTGVADSYEEARQHVLDVLTAGKRETEELGEALRQVRRDFQSTDEQVRSEVSSLWQLE